MFWLSKQLILVFLLRLQINCNQQTVLKYLLSQLTIFVWIINTNIS